MRGLGLLGRGDWPLHDLPLMTKMRRAILPPLDARICHSLLRDDATLRAYLLDAAKRSETSFHVITYRICLFYITMSRRRLAPEEAFHVIIFLLAYDDAQLRVIIMKAKHLAFASLQRQSRAIRPRCYAFLHSTARASTRCRPICDAARHYFDSIRYCWRLFAAPVVYLPAYRAFSATQ